jgi:putative N6-adenine-specific DNA methylase
VLPRTDYDTLVVTSPGLEHVTQRELAALGVNSFPTARNEPGVVPVRVPLATLYTLNLNLRTASRITVLAANFRARTFAELERRARAVPWDNWLKNDTRVRMRVTCRKSRLYHSDAVAERVAGAIAARTSAQVATAAADDEDSAEQLVLVRLLRDECTIRVDSSGAHLHRRGYRQAVAKAPLRETLAAAMLLATEWNPDAPLIDPFCGSGTIAIEAALLARNIAPGINREFAFMQWPSFDKKMWSEVVHRTRSLERNSAPAPIVAADRDEGATDATRANAERAGALNDIEVRHQALSALEPPNEPGWLITNPPYGVRVGDHKRLRDLYAALGRLARERLRDWHIALLSAHPQLDAQLGLPTVETFKTTNGGLNVRLVQRVLLEEPAGGAAAS